MLVWPYHFTRSCNKLANSIILKGTTSNLFIRALSFDLKGTARKRGPKLVANKINFLGQLLLLHLVNKGFFFQISFHYFFRSDFFYNNSPSMSFSHLYRQGMSF